MSTLVSSIISDALRETNLIPLGVSPTTDQSTEAFRRLSVIVANVFGNEVGEDLNPLPLGGNNINSPKGYPYWKNNLPGNMFVPVNTRLMLNLTAPGTVNLHPDPHNGARMSIIDVSGNLATNTLTVNGNGRMLEGVSSLVFNTNGQIREWFYREDLGSWVVVSPLDINGSMPFPSDFDDLFIIMLAMRLNPRYGQVMHPASMETLKEGMSSLRARYTQTDVQEPSETGLLMMTGHSNRFNQYSVGDSNSQFNSGYPY